MPRRAGPRFPRQRRSRAALQPGPGQLPLPLQYIETAVNDFPTRSTEETPEPAVPPPAGLQGPFGPSPQPDWDYYWPTNTRNPDRKYTQRARYSRRLERLEVVFRDGTPWHWDNVFVEEWTGFKRWNSTYDFIRNPGFQGAYGTGAQGGWGSIVGE
jgi:hypothetical protein